MLRISLLAALALSSSAFAAPTGTLTLSGTVAAVNDLIVTPNGTNNTTLDILNGETNKNVASVEETSNNPTGYKIFASSANNGELQHQTDATQKTTYTLSYDGQPAVALATSAQELKNVSSLSGLTSDTSAVAVNVTANATAIAGTYSDTVTFSIVAN